MAEDGKTMLTSLRKLDKHVDSLEDALQPLLENLDGMSSQLPLLDKAKLFTLVAYAIDSLAFSSLQLQGTNAKEHAVYDELKRVQQYFGKIKTAEEPPAQRSTTVNQEGMARILKSDLSDNKDMRTKLAEKIAEEKAKALLKASQAKQAKGNKRSAEEATPTGSASEEQQSRKKKQKHKEKGKSKKR